MGCAFNLIHPFNGISCYDLSVRPSVSILLSVCGDRPAISREGKAHRLMEEGKFGFGRLWQQVIIMLKPN